MHHTLLCVRNDFRHEGVPGDKEKGVRRIVCKQEDTHPDRVGSGPCREGRVENQQHRQRVWNRGIAQKRHTPAVRMGAPVGKAGNQRVCNRIDDLADSRQKHHDCDESEQPVLGQQTGQAAGSRGLKEIDQVIANHSVKQPLGHIRKAVAKHFSFWRCLEHFSFLFQSIVTYTIVHNRHKSNHPRAPPDRDP